MTQRIFKPLALLSRIKQRRERKRAQLHAREVSRQIDEAIAAEKKLRNQKKHSTVKVLVLGPSRSGKSTVVKRECGC